MCPIEHRGLETLGIVNWVEIDAWELSSQVQHKHNAEGSPQRKFTETRDPLSPSHPTKQIPIRADRQQLTLTEVASCAVHRAE
jgi:hypothetical protein